MPPICFCLPELGLISTGLVLLLGAGPLLVHVLERRYQRREVRRRLGSEHVHEWRAVTAQRARCSCGDELEVARRVGA